ncbi:hypothetical protein HSX11_19940 [Oxalobacteraceae bacterium]|nr:hypothetical protein [Oxalobacteraceae bacterium]
MSDATISFRVDQSLKDEFANAAKIKDSNSAELLREFMRDYVKQQQDATAYDEWFRREVQIGIDAADAGDVVSDEQMEAEAIAWRAE